jgi:hypothetical protein
MASKRLRSSDPVQLLPGIRQACLPAHVLASILDQEDVPGCNLSNYRADRAHLGQRRSCQCLPLPAHPEGLGDWVAWQVSHPNRTPGRTSYPERRDRHNDHHPAPATSLEAQADETREGYHYWAFLVGRPVSRTRPPISSDVIDDFLVL